MKVSLAISLFVLQCSALAAPEQNQEFDRTYSDCRNVVPGDHPDFLLSNEVASEKDTVLAGPKHGKVVLQPNGAYLYVPDKDFLGRDEMTFLVTYRDATGNRIREKVHYSLHVGNMAPEYGPCPDYALRESSKRSTEKSGGAK